MIEAIAAEAPPATRIALRALLRAHLTDAVLDRLGQRAKVFDPLLHNTASPTIVRGGHTHNVHPGEVSVDLDCRLLPGFGPEDASQELRQLAGVEIETDVRRFDPGPRGPNMSLFDTLAEILRDSIPPPDRSPCSCPRSATVASSRGSAFRPTAFSPCSCPKRCGSLNSSTPKTSAFRSMRSSSGPTQRLLERMNKAPQ